MLSPKTISHTLLAGTLSALGIAALAWNAEAQPPRPPVSRASEAPESTARPASKPGSRKVFFVGDAYKYVEKTKIWDLTGNVKITSEDTILTTAAATYNMNTKIAASPGPLKIEDTLNTVVGKTGTAYYQTRDAKLRGAVVITVRPRDEDRNAPEGSPRRQFDAPATITCESVDYNWGSRVGILTGKLTVKQKDRTVTADKATYLGKGERILLEGNVFYTNSKGEKLQAKRALIIFKEGAEEFQAEGQIKGEMIGEDTIEDPPASPASDKPQPEIGKPEPGTTTPNSPETPKPEPTTPPAPPAGSGNS